jgi:hypothetical protein
MIDAGWLLACLLALPSRRHREFLVPRQGPGVEMKKGRFALPHACQTGSLVAPHVSRRS